MWFGWVVYCFYYNVAKAFLYARMASMACGEQIVFLNEILHTDTELFLQGVHMDTLLGTLVEYVNYLAPLIFQIQSSAWRNMKNL